MLAVLQCLQVTGEELAKALAFSVIDGILVSPREKRNLSFTFPFLKKSNLNFAGLELILAYVMSRLRPGSSHLQPGIDVVATVSTSMNALTGDCWVSDLESFGPLHRLYKQTYSWPVQRRRWKLCSQE